MTEIIDLMSSLSVLIASLAGLIAINKWKKERFEKVKIEAIEKYEAAIVNVSDSIESFLKADIRELIRKVRENDALLDGYQNSGSEVDIVLNKKESEIFLIGKEVVEAKKLLRNYSGYAGNSMAFSFNYFCSSYDLMLDRLRWVSMHKGYYEGFSEDTYILYMIDFIKSENTGVDLLDYMAVQNIDDLIIYSGSSFDNRVDKREDINGKVLKIIAAEKIRLHSMLLIKILMSLKIFLMKYHLVGKVVLASKDYVVTLGGNGEMKRYLKKGESWEEVEEKNREHVFFKLLGEEMKSILY